MRTMPQGRSRRANAVSEVALPLLELMLFLSLLLLLLPILLQLVHLLTDLRYAPSCLCSCGE